MKITHKYDNECNLKEMAEIDGLNEPQVIFKYKYSYY